MAGLASRAPETRSGFEGYAAIGLWVASLPLLIGNAVDLGTLWLLQRESGPAWEFIAVGTTIDAYPRIALAFGLLFPAIYFQRRNSLLAYRILAGVLILLALVVAALGIMLVMDYFVLRQQASPQSIGLLQSTVIKGVGLSGAFFLLFAYFGVRGLRKPKQ